MIEKELQKLEDVASDDKKTPSERDEAADILDRIGDLFG